MLSRIGQLYRCTQHVPIRQLGRRAWLNVKRRVLVTSLGSAFRGAAPSPLPVQGTLPKRIMPPRRALVQELDGVWSLTQLGDRFALSSPMDWQLIQRPGHSHLQRLTLHYHEFLESIPGELGRELVLHWIRHNPPWQSGYWLDSWNCYAISIRCVCWMQWFAENETLLNDAQRDVLLRSLVQQLDFLSCNLESDICGNHLIKNIKCLLWGAAFFDGDKARKWYRLAKKWLTEQLPLQILDDGMHYELSPAYHCQVFVDLLECAHVLKDIDRESLMITMTRAAQATADLTHPDGLISLFSDGGTHMVYSPSECLNAWQEQGGTAVAWTDAIELKTAGYYGARFSRSYFLADCGPICADALPAHGHGDMLAFEWDVDGKRIFVDAGVAEYEPGSKRRWGRSTAAHNTLTIDDHDQAEFFGSFRTGRRSHAVVDHCVWRGGALKLTGQYKLKLNGGTLGHRREFEVREQSIAIKDTARGTAPGEVVSRLLLHHDCQVTQIDDHHLEIANSNTRIRLLSNRKIRIRLVHWSPDFGDWIGTNQLELLCGSLPCDCNIDLQVVN